MSDLNPSGATAPAPTPVALNPTITPPYKAPVPVPANDEPSQGSQQNTNTTDRPRNPDGTFASTQEQNTGQPSPDAATPNDGTQAPTGETPEQTREKEQRRQTANERIRQITAQKHDAIGKADRLARENSELRKQLQQLQSADPNDPSVQMRTAVKSERLEQTANEYNQARQDAAQARSAEFNSKVAAARDTIPNLDTALQSFFQLPVGEIAADVIASSDKAAEIAHYFGVNPQEFYRINALPGYLQAAEIARVENKMAAPVVNRTSQAPRPISPLAGASSPMAFDPEKSSMDEYAARWNADNKARMSR